MDRSYENHDLYHGLLGRALEKNFDASPHEAISRQRLESFIDLEKALADKYRLLTKMLGQGLSCELLPDRPYALLSRSLCHNTSYCRMCAGRTLASSCRNYCGKTESSTLQFLKRLLSRNPAAAGA